MRNLTLYKKYAGGIDPRRGKQNIYRDPKMILWAKRISKTLNQYLDNKEKNLLTNFKQFGGIKLLASRKQTHFGGGCSEGVFNS